MVEEKKFAADAMLGRLARWLRILGCDVSYRRGLSDEEFLALARREGRVLLTRDTRLLTLKETGGLEALFILHDRWRDQLLQFIRACPLPALRLFSRCIECNEPLREFSRDAAEGVVPPYVFQTQERFFSCPRCGRIFWAATHREKMKEELVRLGIGGPTADC